MVSPTPGENLGHLREATWRGGEASLEGTTATQSEGFTAMGAVVVVVEMRPGSMLLVLVLVVKVGAAGAAGAEGLLTG